MLNTTEQLNLYETQQPLFLGESDSELKRCFTSPPPSKPTHLSSYDVDDELLLFLTDAILSSTVVDALIPNTEPYDPGPPKPPLTSSRSPLISTDSKLQIYAPTHNLTPSDDADYEVPPKFPDVISNIEITHTRRKQNMHIRCWMKLLTQILLLTLPLSTLMLTLVIPLLMVLSRLLPQCSNKRCF
ncbi:unnamed protein product [Vicia faba]|uniref:Uncharacterized protein n=1 Tax=Vicia faba TaxID=3906 RepID=A0AAV1ACX2_VICFA|nr:unnamed protein product [Vicia faba]